MSYFNLIVVAALFGALSSCSKVADKSGQDGPFIVQKVEVATSLDSQSNAKWNLPSRKTISFKACIQELAFLNAIKGHAFTVSGDGIDDQTKTSDSLGCIIWQEDFNYNFLAPEAYVTLNRTIRAGAPYKGSQSVQLAVDPWSAAVVDIRFDAAPAKTLEVTKSAAALRGDDPGSPPALLVVDSVGLNFGQAKYSSRKSEIPLEITMSPAAVRTGIDGSGKSVPLAIGRFKLQIALVEKTPAAKEDVRRLLGEKEWTVDMAKGVLTAQAPIELSEIPSPRSSFEMRFKLIPVDGPAGLGSEEGVLNFNFIKDSGTVKVTRTDQPVAQFVSELRAKAVKNRSMLSQRKRPPDGDPFSSPASPSLDSQTPGSGQASTSATDGPADSASGSDCGYKDRQGGFLIDSVQINHAGFTNFSKDQKVPNEIAVSLVACVKNSLDLKGVSDFPYEVGLVAKTTDSVSQKHDTDNAGCLHWSERIRFDYTQSDRWLPMFVKIKSTTAPYLDVTKSLKVFINPWQVGWLHSWDCRSGEPPLKQDPAPAKLHVSDFQWNYTGREFELDSSLRLKLTRKYRFQFRPLLVRKDSSLPTTTLEGSRDGKFRLKMAILAGDEPAKDVNEMAARFLSQYESVITTNNGLGVDEVKLSFMFRELPVIASRNTMVIEVSPVEQGSSLQSITLSTPVQTLDDQSYISYTPIDVNVTDLIARGTKLRAARDKEWLSGQSLLKSSQNLQKLVGIVRLTTDEATLAGLSKEEIQALSKEPAKHPEVLRKFCVLYYANQNPAGLKDQFWKTIGDKVWGMIGKGDLSNFNDLSNCQANPADFLTAGNARHVEKLLTQPTESRADTFSMTLSAMFTKSGSYSTYQGKSMGFEVSGGMKTGLGKISAGPGIEVESYMGIRVDQGQTFSQNAVTWRMLTGEQMDLQFDAEVRDCLHVSGKSRSLAPLRFTCVDSAAHKETIRESWYYLAQVSDFHSTPLRDPHRLDERSWVKMVRGTAQFNAFKSMVEDKENLFVLVPWNVVNDIKKAGSSITTQAGEAFNRNYMVEDGSFPGLIIE